MKFGAVPLAQAEGAILAHGVPQIGGLTKGVVLGADDIAALRAGGITRVMVARLEQGDIGEDAAATALARALVPDPEGQGVRVTAAGSGRVNLMAARAGLLCLDVARLDALNRTDPMLTLASLPDLRRVSVGAMLATIKVISYGVGENILQRACAAVTPEGSGAPALLVRGANLTTATLIETHHSDPAAPSKPAAIKPKGRKALAKRLDRLGAALIETLDVAHEAGAIAQALHRARGQVVFILTASATSDAQDVGPMGVLQAGGRIVHYGMPVDPGNLLFIGEDVAPTLKVGTSPRPVIGLPGCARSSALNGADWVLERVICGLPVGRAEIMGMGVGGLLKDIPERGRSREA